MARRPEWDLALGGASEVDFMPGLSEHEVRLLGSAVPEPGFSAYSLIDIQRVAWTF